MEKTLIDKIVIVWLVGICSIIAVSTHAQPNVVARPLPAQKYLPTNAINKVLIDAEGFVWYGTEGYGLWRDDGYEASAFRSDFLSGNQMLSNYITCIAEDKERSRIFFGTKRGLYYVDKRDYSLQIFEDNEIRTWGVDALLVARDGGLWVSANNSVIHYAPNLLRLSRTESKYEGKQVRVQSLYETQNGTVWALQDKGLPKLFPKGKESWVSVDCPFTAPPTCIAEELDNRGLYIATENNGLYYTDNAHKEYKKVNLTDGATGFIKIVIDPDKKLFWGITSSSVHVYRLLSPTAFVPIEIEKGRTVLNPRDLIIDKNGYAWIMSSYVGSAIYSLYEPGVRTYDLPTVQSMKPSIALPAATYFDGRRLWFCQLRQGLYCFDAATNRIEHIKHGQTNMAPIIEPLNKGKSFLVARDNLHIEMVTYDDDGTVNLKELVKMPLLHGIHVLKVVSDRLWIGTSRGLYSYHFGTHTLTYNLPDIGIVYAIEVEGNGVLLIGTEKRGLCRYNPSDGSKNWYTTSENVTYIATSSDGKVSWATATGNLYFQKSAQELPVSIAIDAGLSGNVISGLQFDGRGKLWILSGNILSVYNEETNSSVLMNTTEQPLSLDAALSLSKTTDGKILIGGSGAFSVFDNSSYIGNDTESNVHFTSWKSNNITHLVGTKEKNIELPPGDKNVELAFSTLNPIEASNIRFSYRYDSGSWNYLLPGQNVISIAGVSLSEQTIEVRSTSANGDWETPTVKIVVSRQPEWYESKIAFGLYAIIIIVLCTSLFRSYMDRKKQRMAETELQNSAHDLSELLKELSGEIVVQTSDGRMNMHSLLSCLKKQLELRDEPSQQSCPPYAAASQASNLSDADAVFINKLLECIEQNMDDDEYTVEKLSADMAMDRTGLYRKLMTVIGKTPSAFMRSARLKRAAELLQQGYTVSEAAYSSGFGTAKYMSRCFQSEYGMKPSEYLKRYQNNPNHPLSMT